MKFFQLKITLGLALGESWPLLAQPQKNTDVHKGILLWESFPKRTCNNHLRLKQGWELMDQIQTIIRDKDKIWYMAKGHPKVGWAPIGFAVATPWTNHPQGIVLDFGYRFRVGPYRFCSDGKPMTLSILLWSYLILSDTHMTILLRQPWEELVPWEPTPWH